MKQDKFNYPYLILLEYFVYYILHNTPPITTTITSSIVYKTVILFNTIRNRDYKVLLSEPNECEASDGRLMIDYGWHDDGPQVIRNFRSTMVMMETTGLAIICVTCVDAYYNE